MLEGSSFLVLTALSEAAGLGHNEGMNPSNWLESTVWIPDKQEDPIHIANTVSVIYSNMSPHHFVALTFPCMKEAHFIFNVYLIFNAILFLSSTSCWNNASDTHASGSLNPWRKSSSEFFFDNAASWAHF